MKPRTLKDWLGERRPRVPEPFLPPLLDLGGQSSATAEALGRMGADALSISLARPGRDREAAFTLLAGDAYLTYACEALVEGDGDVGEGLETLIQAMGIRFP